MRIALSTALLALACNPLVAQQVMKKQNTQLQPPPTLPYDADLFHQNIEVVIASAEFLYWTVQEGAIDYAEKMTQPAWSVATSPSYAAGTVESATYHIDPGFRATVGYFNAPKYWEVWAQYTHFISRGKNRAEPPTGSGEFLTGTWPQITTLPITHAHSDIFFNYNVFDLMIDRVYITNPHFRLRMFGGATATWIKQDWKIHYFDGTGHNTTIRNRWHYVGGGMKVGLSGDWYWGNNIYITGVSSTSAYMGSYHNLSKQTTTFIPTGDQNIQLPIRNSHFSDTRPAIAMQFLLGPAWQQNFGCRRIEVFTGYELNVWFNLQEIRRSNGGTPSIAKETWLASGTIALNGLTTRLTVDF